MTLCGMSIFVLVVVVVVVRHNVVIGRTNNIISAPTPLRDFQGGYTARVYRYVSVENRALHACAIPTKRIDTR